LYLSKNVQFIDGTAAYKVWSVLQAVCDDFVQSPVGMPVTTLTFVDSRLWKFAVILKFFVFKSAKHVGNTFLPTWNVTKRVAVAY
jgi:hypothetical protein